ncbi:MAG: bacteriocin [Bacteroidia bacterium]|nr:bacteriocin [Bacteroidia bacterium]
MKIISKNELKKIVGGNAAVHCERRIGGNDDNGNPPPPGYQIGRCWCIGGGAPCDDVSWLEGGWCTVPMSNCSTGANDVYI